MTADAEATDSDPCPSERSVAPVPRRFWWLKRIMLGVLPLLVVLGCLRWWWGAESGRRLQAEIDRYRAAGQPILLRDFDPEPLPDGENAAVLLTQAAAGLALTPAQDLMIGDLLGRPELIAEHQDKARKVVEDSAKARELAHQARLRPGADWGVRFRSPAIGVMLPALSPQRLLAKVQCMAAVYQHQVGDDAAAVATLRDVFSSARCIDEPPGILINHLVALAISSLATQQVEVIGPDLRIAGRDSHAGPGRQPAARAEVETLIAELLDERPYQRGLTQAFYGERAMQLDAVKLVGGQLGFLTAMGTPGLAPPWGRSAAFVLRPMFELDGIRMMQNTTAQAEAAAQPNWPAAKARLPDPDDLLDGPALQRATRLLSAIMMPSIQRFIQIHFRGLAERRMAATALAIRLYELDHGSRPATLDELVPTYLPAVPLDPFAADGRKIGYRPAAESPVLYSVGPNGLDEGGQLGVRSGGASDWEAKDMPFFLNGDRPRSSLPASAKLWLSPQAEEDGADVREDEGNADEEQT